MKAVKTLRKHTLYPKVQEPQPPDGQSAPKPRRCYPFPWGGGKQTAPGPAAAGRPSVPDPEQMFSSSSQSPIPSSEQRTGTSVHLLICGVAVWCSKVHLKHVRGIVLSARK